MKKIWKVTIEDAIYDNDYLDEALFTTFKNAHDACLIHIREYYGGIWNVKHIHPHGDEDFYVIQVAPEDTFKYRALNYYILPLTVDTPIAYMD